MTAISEAIVREFFEPAGIFVRQHWKHVSSARREDDELQWPRVVTRRGFIDGLQIGRFRPGRRSRGAKFNSAADPT